MITSEEGMSSATSAKILKKYGQADVHFSFINAKYFALFLVDELILWQNNNFKKVA